MLSPKEIIAIFTHAHVYTDFSCTYNNHTLFCKLIINYLADHKILYIWCIYGICLVFLGLPESRIEVRTVALSYYFSLIFVYSFFIPNCVNSIIQLVSNCI